MTCPPVPLLLTSVRVAAALATAYRIGIGVAGAWLTARLTPDRPMKHVLILGAIGVVLGAPCWSRTSSGCYGRSMVGLAWPAQWVYTARRTRTNEGVHGKGQSLGGGMRECDAQTGQFKRPVGNDNWPTWRNLEHKIELVIVTLALRPPRRIRPEVETMFEELGNMSRLAMAVVVGALFTACSGGASESEFVAACMNEGQGLASQMLDEELGVTRDAFCKCGAGVARSSLSSDGYRAMILDMQGKREEARIITSKMSDSEQEAAMMVLAKMLQKCGGAAE